MSIPSKTMFPARNQLFAGCLLLSAAFSFFTGCKPEGYINTVKYNNTKYVNTCAAFDDEAHRVISANSDSAALSVSLFDNSVYSYFFLETGQYEVRRDTLFFRLKNDFPFNQYLGKGVAIHVYVAMRSAPKLRTFEDSKTQRIGEIRIDANYYQAHKNPFFCYKIPVRNIAIDGKQLLISYAIAQYHPKTGAFQRYFCATDSAPIGTAKPAFGTAARWKEAQLQTILPSPSFVAKAEKYRMYESFSGTIDITFRDNEFGFSDSILSLEIQQYINKFDALGYQPTNIRIEGYASPAGKDVDNVALSQRRAQTVHDALQRANAKVPGLTINSIGKGEDWTRVYQLVQRSQQLSMAQKDEVVAILNNPALSNDEHEAALRKLPYWAAVEAEYFGPARHTFTWIDFKVKDKSVPTLERFTQLYTLNAPELERIAKQSFDLQPYTAGIDTAKALRQVNEMLGRKASANLYLMRATYALAAGDYTRLYADLQRAHQLEPAKGYDALIEEYSFSRLDAYPYDEQVAYLKKLTEKAEKNPSDRETRFRRLLVMDRLMLLNAGIPEYIKLLENANISAIEYTNAGAMFIKAHRFEQAEYFLQKAIEKNPAQAEAHYNLAAMYAYKGFTQKAADHLTRAVELKPSLKEVYRTASPFRVIRDYPMFERFK